MGIEKIKQKSSFMAKYRRPGSRSFHAPNIADQTAIRHILRKPVIQPKLKVSDPNDKYEQEANRVANQVMLMPDPRVQRDCIGPDCPEEEEPVRAKQTGKQTVVASPHIESGLASLKRKGQPIPKSTRQYFESRFGADFSKVRVHTGSRAADTAKAVGAKAFTLGRDVVFGRGQYSPGTFGGKKLLAHEFVHVMQQTHYSNSKRISGNSSKIIQRKINPRTGKNENTLTIKVIAPGLNYSSAGKFMKSMSKRGVGHTWIVLEDKTGTRQINGGHTGETGDDTTVPGNSRLDRFIWHRIEYYDRRRNLWIDKYLPINFRYYASGVLSLIRLQKAGMKANKLGYRANRRMNRFPPSADPQNPARWLWHIYQDGKWVPYYNKPTHQRTWFLNDAKYKAVESKINQVKAKEKFYGLHGKQCTSTAKEIAKAAGINLNPEKTIPIQPFYNYQNYRAKLYTNSKYSKILFASPDKMAKEIMRVK